MLSHPACNAIEAIDLASVCVRLMHPHAGHGWSEERTRQAERDYREFLFFASQYPDESPRPTADVDAFWHYHILDTVKYAQDCEKAFGYFLHHGPDPFPEAVRDWRAKMAGARITDAVATVAERSTAANKASWCSLARPESKLSWCSLAKPENKLSWCSLARPESKLSWCSLARPQQTASWCSLSRPLAAAALTAQGALA